MQITKRRITDNRLLKRGIIMFKNRHFYSISAIYAVLYIGHVLANKKIKMYTF